MFDITPRLASSEILLRPIAEADFNGLFECARDKRVWAGHPSTQRYKERNFEQWFSGALNGQALTIIDNKTDRIIGSTRFYYNSVPEGAIAIGYTFLSYSYWGGRTNYQVKSLMFDYAFKKHSSVWMHISPSNIRSQKATLKLGAKHISDEEICLGDTLTLWQCYQLTNHRWLEIKGSRFT